jgi:hypothetical protein
MRTRHLALPLVLAATGAGCMSMQTVQPARVIPQHPAFIWVYVGRGSAQTVTEVLAPRLVGDTIQGTVADLGDPFVASLKDVVEVKAREPDAMKTGFLIGGGLLIGGFTAVELSRQGSNAQAVSTCTTQLAMMGDCE